VGKNAKFATSIATRAVLAPHKAPKSFSAAPDPAGGDQDAPLGPLVGWGGGYPLSIFHPTIASSSSPAYLIPRDLGVLEWSLAWPVRSTLPTNLANRRTLRVDIVYVQPHHRGWLFVARIC